MLLCFLTGKVNKNDGTAFGWDLKHTPYGETYAAGMEH